MTYNPISVVRGRTKLVFSETLCITANLSKKDYFVKALNSKPSNNFKKGLLSGMSTITIGSFPPKKT